MACRQDHLYTNRSVYRAVLIIKNTIDDIKINTDPMKNSKLNLKKSLSLLIILMLGTLLNAQQIKLKNDNVILGEKNIFSYKRSDMGSKFQVYTLKDNEEVLFLSLIHI